MWQTRRAKRITEGGGERRSFRCEALYHMKSMVETVATWGGDYQFCDSGALFPTSVTKRSREVYNGENIPVNIIFVGVEEMYVGIELRN